MAAAWSTRSTTVASTDFSYADRMYSLQDVQSTRGLGNRLTNLKDPAGHGAERWNAGGAGKTLYEGDRYPFRADWATENGKCLPNPPADAPGAPKRGPAGDGTWNPSVKVLRGNTKHASRRSTDGAWQGNSKVMPKEPRRQYQTALPNATAPCAKTPPSAGSGKPWFGRKNQFSWVK